MPVMGLLGMLLLIVFLLVITGLVVLGIVLLVRQTNQKSSVRTNQPIYKCQNCGRGVEPDWKVCPYCGENLGGD